MSFAFYFVWFFILWAIAEDEHFAKSAILVGIMNLQRYSYFGPNEKKSIHQINTVGNDKLSWFSHVRLSICPSACQPSVFLCERKLTHIYFDIWRIIYCNRPDRITITYNLHKIDLFRYVILGGNYFNNTLILQYKTTEIFTLKIIEIARLPIIDI